MKRTEIEALLHVTHIILCIHKGLYVRDSRIDLYCLSKSTTRLARGLLYRSVSSALADHGDLLAELTYILKKLRPMSTIKYHYLDIANPRSAQIPLQHIQTLGADMDTHRSQIEDSIPQQLYINPPHNAVQLYYKSQPLLTQIKSTLRRDLYLSAIQHTICKQENWTVTQFGQVDWLAHSYAFNNAWSTKRITLSKLVHKLLNTNEQNRKFYGKNDTCPCCLCHPETFLHVLICSSPDVVAFRQGPQDILWKQLSLIDTPDDILQAIQLGIAHLGTVRDDYESINFSSSFISAAHQQQTNLGWEAFLRGRISSEWQIAFTAGQPSNKSSIKWADKLVSLVLNYSQQLWIFRCGVLHGHTKEEARQRHRTDLLDHIQAAYEEYANDPFCIPSDWRSLFNRPYASLSLSDRDTLSCWLRSFAVARQQQALRTASSQAAAAQFFQPSSHRTTSPEPQVHPQRLSNPDLDISSEASVTLSDTDDDSSTSSLFDYKPFDTFLTSPDDLPG